MLWEFPGGKLEKGETPERCIIREIKEELNIDIKTVGIYEQTQFSYPQKTISFTFINAKIIGGNLNKNVHSEIYWANPPELTRFEFCPADKEIAQNLSGTVR